MSIFNKIKLAVWLLFNTKSYAEYVKAVNQKLTIFNRFYKTQDGSIGLIVLTSTGEVLKNIEIVDGTLTEALHIFTQDVKVAYNTFGQDYTIVNVMFNDKEPELYRIAANIAIENEKKEKHNASPSHNFIFPDPD